MLVTTDDYHRDVVECSLPQILSAIPYGMAAKIADLARYWVEQDPTKAYHNVFRKLTRGWHRLRDDKTNQPFSAVFVSGCRAIARSESC